MNRGLSVVLLLIGSVIFGGLMGIRPDLPALWMRAAAAAAAFVVLLAAVELVRTRRQA